MTFSTSEAVKLLSADLRAEQVAARSEDVRIAVKIGNSIGSFSFPDADVDVIELD